MIANTRTEILTNRERETLTAIFERMFPADDLGPGATEIGVIDYVERALDEAYAEQLPKYRAALARLEGIVGQECGRTFVALSASEQDAILDRLDRKIVVEMEQPETQGFFDLLWRHLREGLFSDPIYGGNKNMLGWRLIGFPGAQYAYTEEEQQLDYAISREPKGLADIGRGRTGGGH